MHRWKTIAFNIAFALNCLLLFLILFEQHLQVPLWLQVVGRMHPLVLHFPIVLIVLTIFWELLPHYQKGASKAPVGDVLLLSAAFTAVLTSLMGLFLSREDGYTPDVLSWHKWGGVFISFLTLVWYAFRARVRQQKMLLVTTTGLGLLVIVITGHQGANVTHGENFLLAPLAVAEEKPAVSLEDAVVYTHAVKPILEAKCYNCHNTQKAKGRLVMETEAGLLKGGKNGALWDTAARDFGLMFQRIHLPLENKKHMPPQGKLQLTDDEIAILYQWVKRGASFDERVADLPEDDSLRMLTAGLFQTIENDDYHFAAASQKELQKLNTSYMTVTPVATGSPALSVSLFSASQFSADKLKAMLPLKEQIVSLNLNQMPVKDEDLKVVAQFTNLRKLNLSFTDITGATLAELNKLQALKQLSLSGTRIGAKALQPLRALPKLSQLHMWNTAISPQEVAQLQKGFKNVRLDCGYTGDTVVLKLTPPLIKNETQIVAEPEPLQLKHYINGTTIRYTTNGKDPDSLTSPVYDGKLLIDKNMVVKAKAFKKGWISSDVTERSFFKMRYKFDSVQLLTAPDPQYKGDGGSTLMDAQKGDQNFRTGKWLGYKETSLQALLYVNKLVSVSSVTVSALMDIGSFIMPPQQIEVWGGPDAAHLRLLQRQAPPQPKRDGPAGQKAFQLSFAPTTVKLLKVVVKPVSQLPAWHQGKGAKAWVFVDEIFLN